MLLQGTLSLVPMVSPFHHLCGGPEGGGSGAKHTPVIVHCISARSGFQQPFLLFFVYVLCFLGYD